MRRASFAITAPGAALAAALTAAGCVQETETETNLALYCQIKACECRYDKVVLFEEVKPAPIQWRETGEAYCPADYTLTPLEGKSSKFKSRYGG